MLFNLDWDLLSNSIPTSNVLYAFNVNVVFITKERKSLRMEVLLRTWITGKKILWMTVKIIDMVSLEKWVPNVHWPLGEINFPALLVNSTSLSCMISLGFLWSLGLEMLFILGTIFVHSFGLPQGTLMWRMHKTLEMQHILMLLQVRQCSSTRHAHLDVEIVLFFQN